MIGTNELNQISSDLLRMIRKSMMVNPMARVQKTLTNNIIDYGGRQVIEC